MAARVLLVVGALAEPLRDRERDETLYEHREDDEEDDHQAEGGGPCAEAEDHEARAYRTAGLRGSGLPLLALLHGAVPRAVVQEVAEGGGQRRHDDDRPRLEED